MASLSPPYQAACSSSGTAASRHFPSQDGGTVESGHQPLQEGGAAREPSTSSPGFFLLSLFEQFGCLPVLVPVVVPYPHPSLRRLSLPSDSSAHLAGIFGFPPPPAPTANPAAATSTPTPAPAPAPAPGNPPTAAMTAPASGHTDTHRSSTLRPPQPSDVTRDQHIFREDITPGSPTDSWAEGAWGNLPDWNPPRSYH